MEMLAEFGAVPVQVDFWVDSLGLPYRFRRHFYRREGWLQAVRCKLDTIVSSHEKTVLAACNEQGEIISEWYASRLLDMECGIPKEVYFEPPPELDDISDALYWDFLGTCDLQNLRMLRDLENGTEQKLEELSSRADEIFEDAEGYVSSLRRKMRSPDCAPENRRQYRDDIDLVENKLTTAMRWVRSQMDDIRSVSARTERDILDSLTVHGEKEALFTIHWRTRSNWRQIRIDFPLQQTERPNPGIDVNSETAKRAASALARATYEQREKYLVEQAERNQAEQSPFESEGDSAPEQPQPLQKVKGPLVGNTKDNPNFLPASVAKAAYAEGYANTQNAIGTTDDENRPKKRGRPPKPRSPQKSGEMSKEEIKRRREIWRRRRERLAAPEEFIEEDED